MGVDLEDSAAPAVARRPDVEHMPVRIPAQGTSDFFDWVVRTQVKDLPRKLNATSSTGYNHGLWREWTGKTVEELEAEWKKSLVP